MRYIYIEKSFQSLTTSNSYILWVENNNLCWWVAIVISSISKLVCGYGGIHNSKAVNTFNQLQNYNMSKGTITNDTEGSCHYLKSTEMCMSPVVNYEKLNIWWKVIIRSLMVSYSILSVWQQQQNPGLWLDNWAKISCEYALTWNFLYRQHGFTININLHANSIYLQYFNNTILSVTAAGLPDMIPPSKLVYISQWCLSACLGWGAYSVNNGIVISTLKGMMLLSETV